MMKKYIGEIFWIKLEQGNGTFQGGNSSNIRRAILKDNIFSIDNENPDEMPNSQIRLKSKDGYEFNGSAKFIDSPKSSAVVNMFYYYNGNRAFLRGEWTENKIIYMCLAKLTEVNNFED
jgi:hypothetical protein